MKAELSQHYRDRQPSDIRKAQLLFLERPDRDAIRVVNLAIGNVSLPMHPAMRERLSRLAADPSPFASGVVRYTPTAGTEEAQRAFKNVIASSGLATDGLHCVVTDGGSQAMELMVLGVCGPGSARPLLLLDPAYSNYRDIAARAGVDTVCVERRLDGGGCFAAPDLGEVERIVESRRPAAVVVIPSDNPTGQFMAPATLTELAALCVRYGMWLVSDEAYRELHYAGGDATSVWRLSEDEVPGVTGRRISIESSSKVWNACGLRVGAFVTDDQEMAVQATAEYTANLCSNAIGQWIFGALADVPPAELRSWFERQRSYYEPLMRTVTEELLKEMPGVVVSSPEAALYSVVDVGGIAPDGFRARDFVSFCAERGKVAMGGADHTLLVAPMGGFYGDPASGETRMRIAYVEPPEEMEKVPRLFAQLFASYVEQL